MSEPQNDCSSKEPPLADRLVKWAVHKESKLITTGVREYRKAQIDPELREEVDGCMGKVHQSRNTFFTPG
jgi:hypothetical protein